MAKFEIILPKLQKVSKITFLKKKKCVFFCVEANRKLINRKIKKNITVIIERKKIKIFDIISTLRNCIFEYLDLKVITLILASQIN